MTKDNYLFDDQLLEVETENLTIRIIDKGACNLFALCYVTSPTAYDNKNKLNISPNDSLLLQFSFLFKKYYDEISFYYGEENDNYIIYYEEARLAIDEVLKWKEFWLQSF